MEPHLKAQGDEKPSSTMTNEADVRAELARLLVDRVSRRTRLLKLAQPRGPEARLPNILWILAFVFTSVGAWLASLNVPRAWLSAHSGQLIICTGSLLALASVRMIYELKAVASRLDALIRLLDEGRLLDPE
jgi:hypothetical protein